MKWSISMGSCIHTDIKTLWRMFDPKVLLSNFNRLAQEIEERCGIDCVGLSFHPMRMIDSKKFLGMLQEEKVMVNDIDIPDIVNFFDRRMINEFTRKQTIKEFIDRQKNHVGWRLLNLPDKKKLVANMSFLTENVLELVLIRSGIGIAFFKKKIYEKIIEVFLPRKKAKIGFEVDSFYCSDLYSYLDGIFIFKAGLNRDDDIGIALDPAHLYQGEAMGLWGDIYNVLENIRKPVLPAFKMPVFSLDYNPVQILDQEKFDSKKVERTEEAMDEVIKMHCHPDQNVIDYPKYLKKVLEYFPDTLEEIVIEISPADRDNLGDKFFDDIREMNKVCEEVNR